MRCEVRLLSASVGAWRRPAPELSDDRSARPAPPRAGALVRSRAYTILFERDETGMWCATVPLLPGCVSQGATKAEAKRKLREAIALHRKAFGGSAP